MEDSKQKVILQIIPSLQSGGVERGTIDIAKSLKKHNFIPMVASSGGVLTYDLKEAKIEHFEIDVKSKNPLTIFLNIKNYICR